MAKGQREVEERNDTGLLSLMRRLLRIYGEKSEKDNIQFYEHSARMLGNKCFYEYPHGSFINSDD